MDFFFGNLFWGVLIILIGLSIVLKGFGLKIPLVSIFFAVIIIMFGVKILIGSFKKPSYRAHAFKEISETHREYTTVFGGSNIDLGDLGPNIKTIEITNVFASSFVELPDSIDFEIETNAVFGSVITPKKIDGGLSSSRQNLGVGSQKIRVEATAVFGRLEFILKPTSKKYNQSTEDNTDF